VNILTYHYFDFGRVILAYELKQTQMDFIRIAKCINAEMIRIIYIYTQLILALIIGALNIITIS
jgi:hypothetical protein